MSGLTDALQVAVDRQLALEAEIKRLRARLALAEKVVEAAQKCIKTLAVGGAFGVSMQDEMDKATDELVDALAAQLAAPQQEKP